MEFPALVQTPLRTLLLRPAYAGLVVATLALGIGGATSIFALVQGVLLVRSTVARLRPDIPVYQARMLSDYVADQTGQSRALGVTTTLFGVVAALLAALGIFGVLSRSGSVFAGRALDALLFEVEPWDPVVYAAVLTGLMAVAGLAALRPAMRAARTHPVEVLKEG